MCTCIIANNILHSLNNFVAYHENEKLCFDQDSPSRGAVLLLVHETDFVDERQIS